MIFGPIPAEISKILLGAATQQSKEPERIQWLGSPAPGAPANRQHRQPMTDNRRPMV
jgi:hypothetical protein